MALSWVDGSRYHWTKPVPRDCPILNSRFEILVRQYVPLEERINYSFKNKAFTHGSFPSTMRDGIGHMRPLDFLGDAAIKFLLTVHLYGCIEPLTSYALTLTRQRVECNRFFGFLVVRHGWHKFLRCGSSTLNDDIVKYVKSVSRKDYEDTVDCRPPKPLADVFESLAAAIYLDSNLNLDIVWNVVYPILQSQIQRELCEVSRRCKTPSSYQEGTEETSDQSTTESVVSNR
ncbi:endoribonuclease Dicer-like isoform X2 [Ornithodoros turicata]|uniref:endoribonuclease Dicer-like isoform X2 n=1 Tax=Ornithodoros turicata TaxID=34597 RepID=UPI0031392A28